MGTGSSSSRGKEMADRKSLRLEEGSRPLELESSKPPCGMWMLRIEPGSFIRVTNPGKLFYRFIFIFKLYVCLLAYECKRRDLEEPRNGI